MSDGKFKECSPLFQNWYPVGPSMTEGDSIIYPPVGELIEFEKWKREAMQSGSYGNPFYPSANDLKPDFEEPF